MEEIDSSSNIIAESTPNPLEDRSINVHVGKDEEVVIGKRKKENKPSFMMVGNGRKNHSLDKGTDIMDFIKLMTHMTPQELFVIDQMKDHLLEVDFVKPPAKDGKIYKETYLTNIALVRMSPLTNADQQKFKTGFKRLSAKDIVRRTKRSHYIFNPSFIIPRFYQETLKKWNNAEDKKVVELPQTNNKKAIAELI